MTFFNLEYYREHKEFNYHVENRIRENNTVNNTATTTILQYSGVKNL